MSYAVHATARFFDHVVEDTVTPDGAAVILGGTDVMAVPRPAGKPHLAKLTWTDRRMVTVEDGDGRLHLLGPDDLVTLDEGPIRLELRLVRRFRLRRMAGMSTIAGTMTGLGVLFIILNALGITTSQVVEVNRVWCDTWVGEVAPPEALPVASSLFRPCQEQGMQAAGIPGNEGPSDRWAEYLERILDEDFAGEEMGVLAEGDRQHGDGQRDDNDIYIPAGDKGPTDRMGGAEETSLRAQRTPGIPEKPEPEPPAPEPKRQDRLVNEDVGTPVDLSVDAVADAEDPEPVEEKPEAPEQRTEDREGWGLRDWYDQKDAQRDQQEIDLMKGLANRILAIDPNDPEALSIKAYYEYLSEDYEKATKTYDRFIELYPEDPAGYNNKALIYKRRGQYAEEERLYRVALTLRPDDETALNNLAVNLAHQGRHGEALQIMEQLEVLDPGDPYADLHRAKVHAEMGDEDKALFYLEKALQGMRVLDTLHHIEFRQDIRVDPSFEGLRQTRRFRSLLWRYYGDDSPLPQE